MVFKLFVIMRKKFSINYTGYRKPIKSLTLGDVSKIIDIIKSHCIKVSIPEINQFAEGLASLGVLDAIKKYPDIMKDFFVDNHKRLTAGKCEIMFIVVTNCIFSNFSRNISS